MIRPTPGPFEVCYAVDNHGITIGCSVVAVEGDKRIPIAVFGSHGNLPSAEANARAWVEGRAAVETLERIRAAMAMVAPCERAYEVRDRVLAILEGKASP